MPVNGLTQPRVPFWKIALRTGAPFAVIFGCYWGFAHGFLPPRSLTDLAIPLLVALVMGSFFGCGMAWYASSKMVARQTAIELPSDEEVEYSGFANNGLNGGALYLTNHCLIFKPAELNLGTKTIRIARAEIIGAAAYRWFSPSNGLMVLLRDGDVHRFAVYHNDEWARRIRPANA